MTFFREPVNGSLHFAALLVSLLGTGVLIGLSAHEPLKAVSVGIYGMCMSLAFLASTAHHWIRSSRTVEGWLLKLDHAAIYLFIAGTYTPIVVHLLPGTKGWWILGTVWLMALIGILFKLFVFRVPDDISAPPDRLSTLLYVLMGWVIVFQVQPLLAALHWQGVSLALLGGAAYTVGGIILTTRSCDFWPGRLGHHELWHLCVIAGAVCFYLLVLWHVLPAPTQAAILP